jgi:hypothetical protein
MTAATAERLAAGPTDSLEARWIMPGPLPALTREWFARFPSSLETREDIYLVRPHLGGLSVKLRGGVALEVKAYLGDAGIIDLPQRGRGRLECWRKWSFRCTPSGLDGNPPPGWLTVRKRRHRSWFPLGDPPAACGVAELTEAWVCGESWWSVGFEAAGAASLRHGALEHATVALFARPLPPGIGLGLDKSRSYMDWLSERDDGSGAGARGGPLRILNPMPSRIRSRTMPPRMYALPQSSWKPCQ